MTSIQKASQIFNTIRIYSNTHLNSAEYIPEVTKSMIKNGDLQYASFFLKILLTSIYIQYKKPEIILLILK